MNTKKSTAIGNHSPSSINSSDTNGSKPKGGSTAKKIIIDPKVVAIKEADKKMGVFVNSLGLEQLQKREKSIRERLEENDLN